MILAAPAGSTSVRLRVSYRFSHVSVCDFVSLPPLLPGTVAKKDGDGAHSAVCAEHPMADGAHYVEMTLLEKGGWGVWMGVVGQGFDAAGGGMAWASAEGWLLNTRFGYLRHAGRGSDWEGMPQEGEIKPGDVVGLLLDVGQRTLSVYLNGARRGVMVAPGMKDTDGVAPLAGPLRWAVGVSPGASVRIAAAMPPLPPPLRFSVAGPDVVLTEKSTIPSASSLPATCPLFPLPFLFRCPPPVPFPLRCVSPLHFFSSLL
eukprot:COSAG06_NODE_2166_length_7431_cov_10.271959_9_plen_259_part_00